MLCIPHRKKNGKKLIKKSIKNLIEILWFNWYTNQSITCTRYILLICNRIFNESYHSYLMPLLQQKWLQKVKVNTKNCSQMMN